MTYIQLKNYDPLHAIPETVCLYYDMTEELK